MRKYRNLTPNQSKQLLQDLLSSDYKLYAMSSLYFYSVFETKSISYLSGKTGITRSQFNYNNKKYYDYLNKSK